MNNKKNKMEQIVKKAVSVSSLIALLFLTISLLCSLYNPYLAWTFLGVAIIIVVIMLLFVIVYAIIE